MFRSYLISAFRNLRKNRLFSFINILGLTAGTTTCLLILYYVNYEKSYDTFHENHNRIYRLRYERTDQNGEAVRFASCCPPAALRIRAMYPEVEKVARIFRYTAAVSRDDNGFIEDRLFFAEPEFLEILKFPILKGDRVNGLKGQNRAFLSKSTAKKYFGDQDPMGKTISVDRRVDYEVAGVFEDMPPNSHVKCDILLSYANLPKLLGERIEESWGDTGFFTYLLFREGADPRAFAKKLPALVDAEFGEALRAYKLTCELPLQPLTDIHLTSHFMQELDVNGDRDTVTFLSIIALFIIIIAWVNYVNLSTARSLTRAKEVGLRKVVGASRMQLAGQFFLETIVINAVALVFTLGMLQLLLPAFRQITGTPAEYVLWIQSWFWMAVATLFVVGVILSGFYPVIVLSSFKPVAVLRGKLGSSARGMNLRKTLVVFQFVMAIALITGTVVVFRQLAFMKNQDPGFSLERKLVVKAPRVRDAGFGSRLTTFKEQLLAQPGVENFCVVTEVPGRQILWDAGGIRRVGSDDNRNYQIVGIDYDYVDVFRLNVVKGRNFSREFRSDTSALLLNETGAKWMGFASPDSAVGQQVIYWDDVYTIVGIVKDYHQQFMKQAFEPHIFRLLPYGRGSRGMFALTVNAQNTGSTITTVRKLYSEFFPGNPFEYFFLDEYYGRQYAADERFGTVIGIFALLAILVTSLGILGLSSFMVVQRTKEIGIRKVLGASMMQVTLLMTRGFAGLILLSFVLALPLSYLAARTWLDTFAMRIELSFWLFMIPLVVVTAITGATIAVHTFKAARANPIESLRYE